MNILFRTDSSKTIGLGHLMRCLVLAQRLKKEKKSLKISFATQNLDGNINSKILANGFKLLTLKTIKEQELTNLIHQKDISFLIIDSYEINLKYEKKILQKTNCKVLIFDDTFKKHLAPMILNHGLQVEKKAYKNLIPKASKIFCGSKYTILRDEFFKKYPANTNHKKVGIILGGNDVLNLSLKISKLLHDIDGSYIITIITSSVNQHLKKIQKHTNINLLVDINNIAEVLSQQEFVVCASGGNIFELISLKKKFINIQVADNQKSIVKFLEKNKIHTTLISSQVNKESLQEKIIYITKSKIYNKLDLKFSKNNLAKKILKELE